MGHIKHLKKHLNFCYRAHIYLLVFWMEPPSIISALNVLVELDKLYLIWFSDLHMNRAWTWHTVTARWRGKMMHFHSNARGNGQKITRWTVTYTVNRRVLVWTKERRNALEPFQCRRWWNPQGQLLGLDDAELLLSVSESVSSLPLLAALWAPGLDVDVSIRPGGSEAPLLWQSVCPLTGGGLLINVGMLCRERNYYHSQKKMCFKKGNSTDFTSKFVGNTTVYVKKKVYKAFCGSRGSCAKSDKWTQVMSLESSTVVAEDYKFENDNNLGVWS